MNKKKIILIDEEDIQREYLTLDGSQLRLLKFLFENDYLYEGFRYEIVNDTINWKDV